MKRLFLIPALLLLAVAAYAEKPSDGEIHQAVQTELRSSAQSQIDYMRKVGGEDSVRLAREMGTLVEPTEIVVSDMEVEEVKQTDGGDYDARTQFALAMGEQRDKVNARVRLSAEKDQWQVIKLEKY